MIKGTILTIEALVFIAFAYESSKLTWRQMTDIFTKDGDRISHSTLYTAVHKLGKQVEGSTLLQSLRAQIPAGSHTQPHWPDQRSQYPHTQGREEGVRSVLGLMLEHLSYTQGITTVFFKHTEILQRVLKDTGSSLPQLYQGKSNSS